MTEDSPMPRHSDLLRRINTLVMGGSPAALQQLLRYHSAHRDPAAEPPTIRVLEITRTYSEDGKLDGVETANINKLSTPILSCPIGTPPKKRPAPLKPGSSLSHYEYMKQNVSVFLIQFGSEEFHLFVNYWMTCFRMSESVIWLKNVYFRWADKDTIELWKDEKQWFPNISLGS
ncbi:hypothetical protein BDW02DRAFT_599893 [Decorospora gaudefroyi]|uniref:Uncharacterized protein n=1 Tax=Decorospora gaudefroyi TaxID=184978 RepID=A0A6A5K6A6_9PLEO|nr:hypothetical protein BDW02DRAFT_600614 [Decorospora gaudefroyi]KAF1832506.1 hypothetical protein BDW02DRAFT_599893 [Decorospora gaudefroyi]